MSELPISLEAAFRAHIEELRESPSGIEWCRAHSAIADRMIQACFFEVAASLGGAMPSIAIIATGGYGREELAPFSDLDIAILSPASASGALDECLRKLYDTIHKATKMQIGYQFLRPSDVPGLDAKTRSAVLDGRFIVGSKEAFERFQSSFWQDFPTAEFLLSKLAERTRDKERSNVSPLVVEPNLKFGAGGLRSLHTANWIRSVIGQKALPREDQIDQLFLARNLLHLLSNRPFERLTRGKQAEVADLLGVDLFDFMASISAALEHCERVYREATQSIREARFSMSKHIQVVRGEFRFSGVPPLSEASIAVAHGYHLGLTIDHYDFPSTDELFGADHIFALTSGEPVLRALDRCRLLDRVCAPLAECRHLLPRDSSHEYTVLEHSLQTVRNLDQLIETRGHFQNCYDESRQDRIALYLAALLHDVGKSDPSEPHSITGARIVDQLLNSWQVMDATHEHIVWLVENHLAMALTMRLRDLEQPETAIEFAQLCGSITRLNLLSLLTAADMMAVNDVTWNAMHESNMRDLYTRTRAILESAQPTIAPSDSEEVRVRVIKRLKNVPDVDEKLARIVNEVPGDFLISTPIEVIAEQLEWIEAAKIGRTTINVTPRADFSGSDITVITPDRSGLLSSILGVIYANDLSLSSVKAATTLDKNPIAIDTFSVAIGGKPIARANEIALRQSLLSVLEGKQSVDEVLRQHHKDPSRRQESFTLSTVSGHPLILEFSAPRGRGLAYRLSRLIAESGWSVVSARVGQWAGRGAVAFYITGAEGSPVDEATVRNSFVTPA